MESPINNFSAVERNKKPILNILQEIFEDHKLRVLEVGSGSGEHAAFFATHLKNIVWTTTDRLSEHEKIIRTLKEAKLPNLRGPLEFEVGKDELPRYTYDVIFTANTFHIMNWKQCKNLMKILGTRLREGSQVIIYGPFNYNNEFTSESNAEFDRKLKETDPQRGIRSFEDVSNNMLKNGFTLYKDYEMPANNRMLVFTRLVFMK